MVNIIFFDVVGLKIVIMWYLFDIIYDIIVLFVWYNVLCYDCFYEIWKKLYFIDDRVFKVS